MTIADRRFGAAGADELRDLYATGAVSPVEVTAELLADIGARETSLNAFVTVTEEIALADARAAEDAWCRVRRGVEEAPPMLGIPYALKDLVPTAGIRTTKGSLRFADWLPDEDSPLAARMRGSGGVLLGKTTTSEAGWKADAGNRLNGAARNPYDPARTAGGSSGGAAAAVAAGFVPIAQGGDGAGSVRIPASFCGVVGMKPSPGVIPYYPPTPLGPMVANGALGRTVADTALLMDALSGPNPCDPSSLPRPAGSFRTAARRPRSRLRVGYVPELGGRRCDAEVADAVEPAVDRIAADGHTVVPVRQTPPDRFDLLHTIWTTGFASLFADGTDDLDEGLAAVVEQAAGISGATLAAAHLERQELKAQWAELMSAYDVLVLPTVATTAFAAGDDHPERVDGVDANYLDWAWLTYTFNLTEQPAISLPCSADAHGLPVGIQLVGRHHGDADLVAAAAWLEDVVHDERRERAPNR